MVIVLSLRFSRKGRIGRKTNGNTKTIFYFYEHREGNHGHVFSPSFRFRCFRGNLTETL